MLYITRSYKIRIADIVFGSYELGNFPYFGHSLYFVFELKSFMTAAMTVPGALKPSTLKLLMWFWYGTKNGLHGFTDWT